MLKFAANLSMMFCEVPFLERFEAAAKAGFKYVEYLFPYDYPADVLKAKLDQFGLQQVLFNTKPGNIEAGEWGISALPGRESESHEHIDLALEYALALHCPNVHIMAGVVPEGVERLAYEETFIKNIQYAADKFAPHNINICLEALSPAVKPNYLLVSQYDTLNIVNQIARDNVRIQLDYFHAQNVDGNLSKLTHTLLDKVAHIQIASVPDRIEPDEGEINYFYLFEQLKTLGYRGVIGCEYHPRGKTEDGLIWLKNTL
ncbi:2-oxo-tetronate isomerase [Spirabiliibacterium falconis]|uniref:2-oxo-tetronate isomerase n=1 Tax=Spirabiliibacterium falconis TaxID=572023 RepID=UPI001AAD2BD4|nr:2-oxo-tetronate isomerase [Spirabiliibacterium falconis]MBE2894567.1 hydroxypyruvate isomerase family protein [Spirabiliibacterium falconis]